MEINYTCSSTFFYPFSLGNRHIQVAFTGSDTQSIQNLWDHHVISYAEYNISISLKNRFKHLFFGIMEYIPLVGIMIVALDRFFNAYKSLPHHLSKEVKAAICNTPKFNAYGFKTNKDTHLTDLSKRPANLFYKSLFGKDPTTQPGSKKLFAFIPSAKEARDHIYKQQDQTIINISAEGEAVNVYYNNNTSSPRSLEQYLGKNTFKISIGEIKTMLDSHEVWISPLIPKNFYLGMKKALLEDGIVTLPSNDERSFTIQQILNLNPKIALSAKLANFQDFLRSVEKNPKLFGFCDNGTMVSFDVIKNLSIYQVGAMIVNTEDFYSLVENGYQLAKREVLDQDAIRLISASGIRGFFTTNRISGNEKHQYDRHIMKHTFKTAFEAAGKNSYAVFPAVGMGVWRGDPEIYWTAFLDAVVDGADHLASIFVNPGHQKTLSGKYRGCAGEEFDVILNEYLQKYPNNPNLKKICNLFAQKTDLLLLARNLKRACPEKTVCLFNASDPDVTLGNHVGEYVNNLNHPPTTEENFAAAGTSGLGFQELTDVLNRPTHIHGT